MVQENKRDLSIDVLKGMAIFLMVFDHVGWGSVVHTYIQSFHMPLFFIISGFLYKERTLTVLMKKRGRILLVPYILTGILYLLFFPLWDYLNMVEVDWKRAAWSVFLFPTDLSGMSIASPIWFLPCMFWTEVVYTIISDKVKNSNQKSLLIGILAFAGCIYSAFDLSMLPWSIEPVFTTLLFYHVGNWFKWERKFCSSKILIIFIVSVLAAFLNPCIDMRSARYEWIPLYFLNGILGTIAYWKIAKILANGKLRITKAIVKAASYLSINSIWFLCLNKFLIEFFNVMILQDDTSTIETIVSKSVVFGLTMGCIVLITYMNTYFVSKRGS